MKKQHINEQVTVTALGFRNNLSTYPKKIEYQGLTYSFIDAGLRCLVKSGNIISEIFTLSDGHRNYYLKKEYQGMKWTLLKIT